MSKIQVEDSKQNRILTEVNTEENQDSVTSNKLGDDPKPKPKPTTPTKHPIDQIYDKLHELFGVENQLFCMEFPGRVLSETTYAYETDSIYSMLTRPQTVFEEEFRLVDDLFDVSTVTGGPNGSKLSETYEQVISMLVPQYINEETFQKDKASIREWLLQTITTDIPDENGKLQKVTLSIMELFNQLNQQYLTKKEQWEATKNKRLNDAKEADNLEDFARWLASEAPAAEAAIEAKYADLVVRGYSHEIQSLLGYLDVKSAAEILESARARLRNSSMSSLDESETIYPVQLQPADWAKALSTDFSSEDLCLSPDVMETELIQKQEQLSQLQLEYQNLQMVPTGDINTLRKKVTDAQTKLDQAQSAMLNNFTNAIVTVAQIYFAKNDKEKWNKDDLEKELEGKKAGKGLTPEQWKQLIDLQEKTIQCQQDLNRSSQNLTQLETQLAEAKTTDTKSQLVQLKSQIDSLQREIDFTKNMLIKNAVSSQNQDPNDNKPEPSLVPNTMPPAGEFFDVVMEFTNKESKSDNSTIASASHTSWSVDLLFGSASGESDSSSSTHTDSYKATNTNFSIGFRAMKVTIDRGGWFDPELFKRSAEMYKLGGKSQISSGQPDLTILDPHALMEEYNNNNLFPAFPVSFLIAKDVTIKIQTSETDTQTIANSLSQSSSASGGFLCFSCSHSSSSDSNSKSFYSGSSGSNIIIKIPGPQILGWFLEFVSKDNSQPYSKMPDDYLPPVLKQLVYGMKPAE